MIEVIGDRVQIKDHSEFLEADPLQSVFLDLQAIWNPSIVRSSEDYASYYQRGEYLTQQFEYFLYRHFSEVFDLLAKQALHNDGVSSLLSEERTCLVVMDGLSLREAFLFQQRLRPTYEVDLSYLFSSLPSDTEFFVRQHFRVAAPSALSHKTVDGVHFSHIQRLDELDSVKTDSSRQVVWITYPDALFTEFSAGFRPKDLARIAEVSIEFVDSLLEKFSPAYDKVHITSDHGYVVDTYSWLGLEDFPGDSRYVSRAGMKQHLVGYCKEVNDYFVLVGRFNKVKRGKYVHVRHGGLSLMEVMIPWLVVVAT